MIRQLEIVPFNSNDLLYKPLEHPPAPFLDLNLVALLNGNKKIRVIFQRSLETPAILLEKIVIHASTAPGDFWVFYRGTVHIDKPANPLIAGLEAREAQRVVDAVRQPDCFELLILGCCLCGAKRGEFDGLRSFRVEG